ncbi:MAG: aromatic amino acid transport family protein [Patescibacteria group bacterium]
MGKNRFVYALATLTGTIIGVGLFSLPYIASKVGIWVMLFYFLILSLVSILTSLIYGEIVLRTKGFHRFAGYAERYLGLPGKIIGFIFTGLSLIGAILAYLVVGGQFLFSLFQPILGGSYLIYVLIYFSLGAFLIYFGIKGIAQTELCCLLLFLLALGLIFWRGFSSIDLNNLLAFDAKYFFLPYGAILFSLSSAGIIPEIKEMLSNDLKSLKKVILLSSLIAVFTYLVFILVITGITGENTSTEAITGLKGSLNNGIVSLILIFGFLTTFTSYLTIGLSLKKTLWYDLKIKESLAWAIACFSPLILFLLGVKDFIAIVSLVGGVALGAGLIFTIFIYHQARKKGELKPAYSLNLPKILTYGLILFFVLGIIYEIIYFAGI